MRGPSSWSTAQIHVPEPPCDPQYAKILAIGRKGGATGRVWTVSPTSPPSKVVTSCRRVAGGRGQATAQIVSRRSAQHDERATLQLSNGLHGSSELVRRADQVFRPILQCAVANATQSSVDLVLPARRRLHPRTFGEVVLHLVKRELDATHRMTVLGWAWPLLRQLAQLGILVFIFGSVINLKIPHYPVYVFSGLLSWTWFSTGIGAASTSLLDQRHLIFQPRFPSAVIPVVAITVPLVDLLVALPVLLVLVGAEQGITWTVVFIPLLVVLQLTLMTGIAWLVSAASVYFRDVPILIAVGLQIVFYMTPVFYSLQSVPERYARFLEANPMTTIVEAYRAILLGDPAPGILRFLAVLAVAVALVAVGIAFFRHRAMDFADSL